MSVSVTSVQTVYWKLHQRRAGATPGVECHHSAQRTFISDEGIPPGRATILLLYAAALRHGFQCIASRSRASQLGLLRNQLGRLHFRENN